MQGEQSARDSFRCETTECAAPGEDGWLVARYRYSISVRLAER
jgi:hypothetical protein